MSNIEALVCNLLKCGPADLAMLERVGFDWDDVIEATGWRGSSFTDMDFNSLMEAVVYLGKMKIKAAVNNSYPDPEEDIQSYHNYRDTHVWFEKNEFIYRKHFAEELDEFAKNVGIEIDGEEEPE